MAEKGKEKATSTERSLGRQKDTNFGRYASPHNKISVGHKKLSILVIFNQNMSFFAKKHTFTILGCHFPPGFFAEGRPQTSKKTWMNPARPQLGISFFPKNTEFVTLDFWTLGLWDFETSGLFDCWTLELLDFWTLDFWAFRFAHCCTLGLVDFSTFVFLLFSPSYRCTQIEFPELWAPPSPLHYFALWSLLRICSGAELKPTIGHVAFSVQDTVQTRG